MVDIVQKSQQIEKILIILPPNRQQFLNRRRFYYNIVYLIGPPVFLCDFRVFTTNIYSKKVYIYHIGKRW